MEYKINTFFSVNNSSDEKNDDIKLTGNSLSLTQLKAISRHQARVNLSSDPSLKKKFNESQDFINRAIDNNVPIYGVNTGFGGMANIPISAEQGGKLQENLIHFLTSGAGDYLPTDTVRAAMAVRANSHLKGASGLRYELVQRLQLFLNAGATPLVRELGSIGASGDLVPLSQIAGAVFGLNSHYQVEYKGKIINCIDALKMLDLEPIKPKSKESLSMINGTSMMAGIAGLACEDTMDILSLSFAAHALIFQALHASTEPFNAFIHEMKPLSGQVTSASVFENLLRNSSFTKNQKWRAGSASQTSLVQDRYGVRCAPQFMGPIVDGIQEVCRQITIEINSATDNPLIDVSTESILNGGNFLGQYVGVGMDQIRYYLSLLVRHLDTQISHLVTPEFSNGLPASLVGNTENKVNMGLKGLQICGNSIVPLIAFNGNSIADRFPSYAEQFNQNINSQGFGSANLARDSIKLCQQYLPIALIFAVQAIDLRSKQLFGHYDASQNLSTGSKARVKVSY